MEYIEPYIPKTYSQLGLSAVGAAVAVWVLRALLKKKKELAGKVVVITGASSGIGEALAHEFVKNNCKVVLAARSIDKLERLKGELVEIYKVPVDSVTPFFLDLEDHSSIPSRCDSMISIYGKVDILINNAGIGCRAKIADAELDTFKKVMNINYFGQIAVTKGILPHMIEKGGGTIVAVSSIQGRIALPGGSAYGATKHALQAFSDSLRSENKRHNIDVLVVSPSYVSTAIAHSTLSGKGKRISGDLLISQQNKARVGMSPETCAVGIVHAIKTYETDYLIGPFHHRMIVYIRALCPWLYNFIMARL
ncbi:dehydrogenase/reductase SDR family protein 7-like [Watersipora subatra]|uniref:dehydrogenase/reductase SDR family protein 7-like n=1 Tax=Watersipora subatra TaxID=2589382 RepID=UPI00355C4F01